VLEKIKIVGVAADATFIRERTKKMSTRCQVQVVEVEVGSKIEARISLYHHSDGYPNYIIPIIYKAYSWETNEDEEWKMTRAGKVASLLCWADPGEFEPEVDNDVRWDNSFYYRLYCSKAGDNKKAIWEVDIYGKKEMTHDEFEKRMKIDIFDYISMHKEICKICGATIEDRMLSEFVIIEEKQNIEKLIQKY
jgi:hypothetical protein